MMTARPNFFGKRMNAAPETRSDRVRAKVLIAAAVLGGLALGGCAGKEQVQITGFIQSSKTDDNDLPVEGYIWDGQTQYNLEKNDKLEQILENVDRKVKVDGEVREDWDGNKWIEVDSVKLLD